MGSAAGPARVAASASGSTRSRIAALAVAATAFVLVLVAPTPDGLTLEGQRAIAIFVLCVALWVTHAIPLMITSLLAVVLFPLLGVMDSPDVYAFFGNQAVFFILGAFILSSAVIRSGLSTRIALHVLRRFGRSPGSLLGAVMVIPAGLSFFVPEHAVAAMIFPVVLELASGLDLKPGESPYAKSLFIAMAWGAIIGGVATFLGGARAPLAVGILYANTGRSIGFLPWALAATPIVPVMLFVGYQVLRRVFPPEVDSVAPATEAVARKIEAQGPLSRRESAVGGLMALTVLAWIVLGEQAGLANIAFAAVAVAFVFGLMKWKDVEEDVNWGVFLMYGGAIALGFALDSTGAATWLIDRTIAQVSAAPLVIVGLLALVSVLLTEAISNSAVVALLLPVGLGLSAPHGLSPETLTLAVAIPSGLAYMLPMGTPATAIAFSSGHLRASDTLKAGSLMVAASWTTFLLTAAVWWPVIGFGT
jgi:sodium-dependent dicarboxylate transporter 2/3/5